MFGISWPLHFFINVLWYDRWNLIAYKIFSLDIHLGTRKLHLEVIYIQNISCSNIYKPIKIKKSSYSLVTSLMTFRLPMTFNFIFSPFNYLSDTQIFYSELILMWKSFIFIVGGMSHYSFHLMHSISP